MQPASKSTDRYVSFCGLECEPRAAELVARTLSLAGSRDPGNPFWQLFRQKAEAEQGPDALFLVHSYIFYMRDLFEQWEDAEGLAMLNQVEQDCC